MRRSYGKLATGKTKGDAWLETQRDLIREDVAPHFLAPFVLYGDPGLLESGDPDDQLPYKSSEVAMSRRGKRRTPLPGFAIPHAFLDVLLTTYHQRLSWKSARNCHPANFTREIVL